jgi:ATP-dependent helicase YprA (DUF1998 family)
VQARSKFVKLLQDALTLVQGCGCNKVTGCPGCIHFGCCNEYNAVLHKGSALIVLQHTLAQELKLRNGHVSGMNDECGGSEVMYHAA